MISLDQADQGRRSSVAEAAAPQVPGIRVTRYKVILADDHVEILQRVEKLLAPRFDVVEKCSESESVLEAVDRLQPDVVVLDISMPPGLSGIELARMIRRHNPKPKFVYLTQHEDAGLAQAVREDGGYAYVVKRRLATDLVPAILAVMQGEDFVSDLTS